MEELSSGKFALLGQHNANMAHITDHDFSSIEASFVPVQDLLTSNERQERVLLPPGSGWVEIRFLLSDWNPFRFKIIHQHRIPVK